MQGNPIVNDEELKRETESDSEAELIIAPKRRRRRKAKRKREVFHMEWSDDEYSDGGTTGVPPDTQGFVKIRQGGPRAKNWIFTAWEGWSFETTWYRRVDLFKYMIAGEEVCPDTGTPHFQGYLQLERPCRRSVLQNIFQTGPHTHINSTRLAVAACGWQQNYDYCRKIGKHLTTDLPQGNPYMEAGTPDKTPKGAGQGRRNDIKEFYDMLTAGDKMVELIHHNPPAWAKSHGALTKMQILLAQEAAPKMRPVKVIWIEGNTGIGKTHAIHALEPDLHVQHMKDGFRFWDGYTNQKAVLIDEYANDAKIGNLLAYLDKYVVQVNIKYGGALSLWERIYICTNLPWDSIHPRAKEKARAALTRRIDERWEGWDVTAEEVTGQIAAGIDFEFFGDVVTLAADQEELCGQAADFTFEAET